VISVIIPTLAERAHRLVRTLEAFRENTVGEYETFIITGKRSAGEGWNEGVQQAEGDYFLFGCDDMSPHAGWDVAAVEAVDAGKIPAPVLYGQAGDMQTCGGYWGRWLQDWEITANTCIVPFCSRDQWQGETGVRPPVGPMLNVHYFSDNAFTDRCKEAGLDVVVRRGYAFTHMWEAGGWEQAISEHGDIHAARNARLEHDRPIYVAAMGRDPVPWLPT
jgi:hypothetical protein